jgi:hypothetical protein
MNIPPIDLEARLQSHYLQLVQPHSAPVDPLAYPEHPTPEQRQVLWDEFDTLFVPNTGYAALDFRLQQTAANKEKLLAVLFHPEQHLGVSDVASGSQARCPVWSSECGGGGGLVHVPDDHSDGSEVIFPFKSAHN